MSRVLLTRLVVLAASLLACGGDDDDDATPTASATGSATATRTATAEATAGVAATATPVPTEAPATEAPPTETPEPQPTATEDPGPDESEAAAQAAVDSLATWLGPVADPAAITVDSVEPVTWNNGCLELVRPGQVCSQALVDGYRVMLGLAQAVYEVRTDATGAVTLWAPQTQALVMFQSVSTNLFEFMTDDGNTLVAQLVFGTLYGVEAATLSEGDPVGVGLADAPQSGGFLLVWLDPAQ